MDRQTHFSRRLIPVLLRLHLVMDRESLASCDLDLDTLALLSALDEERQGISIKRLKDAFGEMGDVEAYLAELEFFELIEYCRDETDRRMLACKIAIKGITRSQMADEALSNALIEANEDMTEDMFESFILKLRSYSRLRYPQRSFDGLIPAGFIKFIVMSRRVFVKSCALYGMPSIQLCILNLFENPAAVLSIEQMQTALAVPDGILIQQVERLVRNNLLDERANGYALTDAGFRRLDSLFRQIQTNISQSLSHQTPESFKALETLSDYILYLYG